ncbi:MAG: polyphosphate kinase 1 [Butyrivibrio sp.]
MCIFRKPKNKTYYDNRELSWIKFNERVLEEAADNRNPLCERLSFSSIYQSNLDEFFMVRMGALYDQSILMKDRRDNKTNMTAEEQIDAVFERVRELDRVKDDVYRRNMREIEDYGIRIINFSNLLLEEQAYLEKYFTEEIEPLISPMIVGRNQPFPFFKNKDIYAVAMLRSVKGKEKVGVIGCSNSVFKRLIEIPDKKGYFMLSEELILHFMKKVFKNYRIISKSLIRVIRSADIDADSLSDDDIDYREIMSEMIKRRKKLMPVKMEYSREMDMTLMEILTGKLGIMRKQTFYEESPLDMSFLFEIRDELRNNTELFYDRLRPQPSESINMQEKMIPQILEKDILLSYPYESIKPFISLLNEAAVDKNVLSVKMTLYRVAKHSKIVEALVEAAENGKEDIVLVELRARFDEENNIEWSRRLEDAGCKIIYGIEGYKVHTKLCQITRKTEQGIKYITQIGTGNYNEKTAEIYTDFSLMTADDGIGREVAGIFKHLMVEEFVEETDSMLVAPDCFQNRIISLIEEEIKKSKTGQKAYIGIKINSLTDKKIIDKLAEASAAGVKTDMVVRGICCLISGVKGHTDNIRVISIVGRFLEHSRIYIFGTGESEKIYIGSADFMTRNTVKRVEAAVPVLDRDIRCRIKEMFDIMLKDNVKARIQDSNGIYHRIKTEGEPLNSQEYFYKEAYNRADNKGGQQ